MKTSVNISKLVKLYLNNVWTYYPYLLGDYVLTLENIEPINCIVAKVLGGSLASIPSNALDNETMSNSMNSSPDSPLSTSIGFTVEVDKDWRNSERPTNATDITATCNWWVAVI